jgi:serine O-acetyltransferase
MFPKGDSMKRLNDPGPGGAARPALPELDSLVDQLCAAESFGPAAGANEAMPSLADLGEFMSRMKAALFPEYFGSRRMASETLRYHMAANLDSVFHILAEQIRRGTCFNGNRAGDGAPPPDDGSRALATRFMERIPMVRSRLAGDVHAAFEGDPAARSPGETIFCYPSITVMIHQRIAHELYRLEVPLIPRIITEMAHSATGIDIHPGASIGEEFFIDHGTGVVIGETCIIGNRCRLYQGVTLGALSFPKEGDGSLVKGIPRHPILQDEVTVYAGATILGRITVGKGAVIGGNVWVTRDVAPGSRLTQQRFDCY